MSLFDAPTREIKATRVQTSDQSPNARQFGVITLLSESLLCLRLGKAERLHENARERSEPYLHSRS